jgi:hypothetical protein
MAAAANSKILLKKNKEQRSTTSCRYCSICGKKLKFARTSENPLACWQCMIVTADS